MLDLSKLTPAPWVAWHKPTETMADEDFHLVAGLPILPRDHSFSFLEMDAEFIALARNAFDVMMRRGWAAVEVGGHWQVRDRNGWDLPLSFYVTEHKGRFPDPFTALVEADAWFRRQHHSGPLLSAR